MATRRPAAARTAKRPINAPVAPVAAESAEIQEYPKAMYKKVPESVKFPNGYKVERVQDAADEAAHAKKGFKLSPDDL